MLPETHATPVRAATNPSRARQQADIIRAATARERSQTSPELAIVEATLASGVLVESPSNGGPTGMKWRVRIFEYGLSKNRYPYPAAAQTDLARARLAPTFDHLTAAVPLKWTLRSAREALRHLEGARCFADHSLDCYAEAAADSLRQGATPRIDESSHMARARESVCAAAGCSPGHSVRDLVGFYSDAAMGRAVPRPR